MIKLIKLEVRKNNLKPYLYGVLGIFIFTILLGSLFCLIPILEPNNSYAQMLNNPNMLITIITIVSMSAFAILSSIMYAKFIIEEYTGRKNVLLFTYPQKRSSILLAKFILIVSFSFIAMFISNFISILTIDFITNILKLKKYSFVNIQLILTYSFVFSIVSNLIAIISLRVGFWKKSIIWTIVTSVILISPLGNSVTLFKYNSLNLILIITSILFLISIILFLGLLKKVNKMECL